MNAPMPNVNGEWPMCDADIKRMEDAALAIEQLNTRVTELTRSEEAALNIATRRTEEHIEFQRQRDALLVACKAQHEAIDRLFAMLINATSGNWEGGMFMPSKSGQPWEACQAGTAAIAKAEGRH